MAHQLRSAVGAQRIEYG